MGGQVSSAQGNPTAQLKRTPSSCSKFGNPILSRNESEASLMQEHTNNMEESTTHEESKQEESYEHVIVSRYQSIKVEQTIRRKVRNFSNSTQCPEEGSEYTKLCDDMLTRTKPVEETASEMNDLQEESKTDDAVTDIRGNGSVKNKGVADDEELKEIAEENANSCCVPLFSILFGKYGRPSYFPAESIGVRDYESDRDLAKYYTELSKDQKQLIRHVWGNDVEKVERLLIKGVDANCINDDGYTPVHIAVSQNNVTLLKLLLDYGANADTREFGWGLTPLLLAARDGAEDSLKLLLKLYEPDTFIDRYGFTALSRAAHTGQYESCKMLLEKGANPLHRDNVGFTPMHRAAARGFTEICKLIARFIDVDIGIKKLEEYRTQKGFFANDKHDDIHNIDPSCERLHCACLAFSFRGSRLETPVHLAAKHGYMDVVKALCKDENNPTHTRSQIFSIHCKGYSDTPIMQSNQSDSVVLS